MGAVCCCLRDQCEDFTNPNRSIYRNCICLRCFVQNCLNMYMSLFQRGEEGGISSSNQEASSLNTDISTDNSLSDMFRFLPRPLPYNADPRCFHPQRDRLNATRQNGSNQSYEETEPLTRSNVDEDFEPTSTGNKRGEAASEAGSKEPYSRSSLNYCKEKMIAGYACIYSSSEDEDVCPTCLEEYSAENPKIITKCFHHFHLGCIYEWMERSQSCPICSKVMLFDELT